MSTSVYEFLSVLQAQTAVTETDNASINYQNVLEYVRTAVSQFHANELSAFLDSDQNSFELKKYISRYASEYLTGFEFDLEPLVDKIYEDMTSMGILTKWLRDPEVEEININGYQTIEIVKNDDTIYLTGENAFPSADIALALVKRMVYMGGMQLDAQNAHIDSDIGAGTRISAMIPPLVPKEQGVNASIRKQNKNCITQEQYIEDEVANPEMLLFLVLCICYGVSLGLTGGAYSGKTTLLSYLLNEYIRLNDDHNNRIYIIEDSRELKLMAFDKDHNRPARVIYTMTKKAPNPVTMNDLIINALRFNPKIIVPSEVREGNSCFSSMSAGQTGHNILTCWHADNAVDAYDRIVGMCQIVNSNIPAEQLYKMAIKTWPIVVNQAKLKDRSRKILEIFEATGYENGQVQGQMIFQFVIDETERDVTRQVVKVHGSHQKVGTISDQLYKRLKDNGAPLDLLHKLFPEKALEKGRGEALV